METDDGNLPIERIREILERIREVVDSEPPIKFIEFSPEVFAAWAQMLLFTNLRFLPDLVLQSFPYDLPKLEKIESTLQSGAIDSPDVVNAINELPKIDFSVERIINTPQEIKEVIFKLSKWMIWLLEESESGSLARAFFLNGAIDGGLMSYWAASLYAKLGIIGRTPKYDSEHQVALASDYDATFLLWESEHNKVSHLLESVPKQLFRVDISNLPNVLETLSTQELDALLESDFIVNFSSWDEIWNILSARFETIGDSSLKAKWDKMLEEKSFNNKLNVVAQAYFSRFDDDADSEVLQRIFEQHDMSGAIALAVVGGDVEIKSDDAKQWIENTYEVLTAIFSFPEEEK